MTANAKPSWMPSEQEIDEAVLSAINGKGGGLPALISRAALDAQIEALESMDSTEDYILRVGDLSQRLAALRAEREALL